MARFPRDPQEPVVPPPMPVPAPSAPRRVVNRSIVFVLLVIVAAAWFLKGAVPSVTWSDVMNWAGVVDKERYTRLMVLGCLLVAITLIVKILRSRP